MKSGFEKEIRPVRAGARRGRKVVLSGLGFGVLHSNMVGKLMFLSSVKPNQSESNQIKPVQTISSAEPRTDGVLTAAMTEGMEMGLFDATLLKY